MPPFTGPTAAFNWFVRRVFPVEIWESAASLRVLPPGIAAAKSGHRDLHPLKHLQRSREAEGHPPVPQDGSSAYLPFPRLVAVPLRRHPVLQLVTNLAPPTNRLTPPPHRFMLDQGLLHSTINKCRQIKHVILEGVTAIQSEANITKVDENYGELMNKLEKAFQRKYSKEAAAADAKQSEQ